MTQSEERASVARFLKRRDEGAFRALYRRYTPVLYLLARRLLGGARDHAEDVVQETWIRAVTALPAFQWQSSLQTWLCGIAVNCSREALRRVLPRNMAKANTLIERAWPCRHSRLWSKVAR